VGASAVPAQVSLAADHDSDLPAVHGGVHEGRRLAAIRHHVGKETVAYRGLRGASSAYLVAARGFRKRHLFQTGQIEHFRELVESGRDIKTKNAHPLVVNQGRR
jgi:hypothetical protein